MILVAMLSHHLSGALAVSLIILLVGALVGTLDIRPVLGALIISNYWVGSAGILRHAFRFFSRCACCHLSGYPYLID